MVELATVSRVWLGYCAGLALLACGNVSSEPESRTNAGGAAGTGADSGTPGACEPPTFEDPRVDEQIRQATIFVGPESLSFLTLSGAASLRGLECLVSLEDLSLYSGTATDLGPIGGLTKLRLLYLEGTSYEDLSPLSGLTALESFAAVDAPIRDLSPLAGLTRLVQVSADLTNVEDLSPLAALPRLVTVTVVETPVSDISPLAELPELALLRLSRSRVTSLMPLYRAPGPANCQDIWALETNLDVATTLSAIPRLCGLGWAVRWSLPGEKLYQQCGEICDPRP
jgi:hypothetical protein